MAQLIYKDLSYKLNGIFYFTHNKLGRFCEHKQYCDAIEKLFIKEGIKYQREVKIPIDFIGYNIEGNRIDFLMENKIPIDVKAKKFITTKDYIQMKRYLRATRRQLGLVVNFRDKSIKTKRILNSQGNI